MKNQLINIFSLHRAGHHAVIYWILNKKSSTITSEFHAEGSLKTTSPSLMFLEDTKEAVYYYNNINFIAEYAPDFLNKKPKTYELMINSIADDFFPEGPFDYIVLRDFLNVLSSRLKKWSSDLSPYTLAPQLGQSKSQGSETPLIRNAIEIFSFVEIWKNLARIYLKTPWKVIKYNEWVVNKNYRSEVCLNLDIPVLPDITRLVPPQGGGSSFINQKLEGNTNSYLTRYEQIKIPSQFYPVILGDSELIELNKIIFNLDLVELLEINKSL